MTEWTRRASPEFNQMYADPNLNISPYTSTNGFNYLSTGLPYPQFGSSYSAYSASYIANENQADPMMYMPPSPMALNYQVQPTRGSNVISQPRTVTQSSFYGETLPSSRQGQLSMRYSPPHVISLADTEDQESFNQESQSSEPVEPPLEGYPDVEEFDRLINHYVANLSPKKQDKALIHAKRAANIKAVLIDKKTTSVESAQFRFWVKKMFTLHPNDQSVPARKKKICHDNKPVAIREKLFKILTRAHKQCQHGGRDKTSAQVRRVYSWVPKELISRFVKICPTCQVRRGTNRGSPTGSDRSHDAYMDTTSPETGSPDTSRRTSVTTNHSALRSSVQMSGFSSTFQQQNRWMQPIEASDETDDHVPNSETDRNTRPSTHISSRYDDNVPLHWKHCIAGSWHNRSGMDSHQAMDYTHSPYDSVTPQDMSYHNDSLQYKYKPNHCKE